MVGITPVYVGALPTGIALNALNPDRVKPSANDPVPLQLELGKLIPVLMLKYAEYSY
jgi:hypothetical protein